jgi:hypothetical protein
MRARARARARRCVVGGTASRCGATSAGCHSTRRDAGSPRVARAGQLGPPFAVCVAPARRRAPRAARPPAAVREARDRARAHSRVRGRDPKRRGKRRALIHAAEGSRDIQAAECPTPTRKKTPQPTLPAVVSRRVDLSPVWPRRAEKPRGWRAGAHARPQRHTRARSRARASAARTRQRNPLPRTQPRRLSRRCRAFKRRLARFLGAAAAPPPHGARRRRLGDTHARDRASPCSRAPAAPGRSGA